MPPLAPYFSMIPFVVSRLMLSPSVVMVIVPNYFGAHHLGTRAPEPP